MFSYFIWYASTNFGYKFLDQGTIIPHLHLIFSMSDMILQYIEAII